MKPYPYLKVLIWFTLAPAIGGIITGFFMFASMSIDLAKESNIIEFIAGLFGILTLTTVVGEGMFIVAAFPLAVIYTLLKLHKSMKSFIFIFFCGGLGSMLCATFIAAQITSKNGQKVGFQSIINNWPVESATIFFLLGAISSLLMGCYVLPKKELPCLSSN
jgi:hypothetical protein